MKGRVTWIRESCAPPARQLPSRRHVRSRASSHAVAGDQLRGAASGAVVAGEDQLLGERQRRRRGGEDRPLTPRSPTGVESSLETSFLEHILLPLSPRIPASGARLRPEKTTHSRPSHLPQEPESSLNTSFLLETVRVVIAVEETTHSSTSKSPSTAMTNPPAAVRHAVENFQSRGPFTVVPPRSSETSFIFNWGVRGKYEENGKNVVAWVCLADEGCRTSGTNLIKLHAGKTTLAVKHLQKLHHITSPKTTVANENKRKFEEDTDHFKSSVMYRNNPGRLRLLLTAKLIVNRNHPFRVVEYEEAKLMDALVCKEEMKANITTPRIKEAIGELYSSTKREATNYLVDNKEAYPTFTLVADFWSCKITSDKFLGARVYLVDREWPFKSVLLGTRKFNPAYGDRDGDIQKPFKAWLDNMLNNFGLERQHFYGVTSDHGGDVRSMLKNGMNLHWEWYMLPPKHRVV
ncbi:hypothetical protein PC129_g10323 [Phytophthora cactorum]|uniref:Uncharacterized protein n=3 Tax=Phytophthora cactorum TaxID=29920 RepID=A0A8T1I3E9_9STRA|nr:hypothetical protein C6341_g16578 [Phytophthora cactorum]KAG3218883.1 hypothetical protein PC129_g10323 [Phytophthora cactorum]